MITTINTTQSKMKQLLIILITTLIFALTFISGTVFGQVHYVQKGLLRYGVKVQMGDRLLPLDSLSDGFNPETGEPINLVIPEGSGIGLEPAMVEETDMALIIDNEPPTYINRPSVKWNGISMSSSPGSQHSYTLVDEINLDTLRIAWTVGYAPVQLSDLYPAEFFKNYVAIQFQYIFESYPDTSMYNWKEKEYIGELNARGLPVNPSFPYSDNGLYFVIDQLTVDARVQLTGLHDKPQSYDPEDPFDLFLYEDLQPGDYEFIVWPYEGAPENVTLQYPFTILKPWWQETPAIAAFTLLAAVLIGGTFFAVYRNRQQRRTRDLEWSKQLTEAELKAIRAQLNPHFLFNALNSIQNLVSQDKNDAANSYIRKLSKLLRQVLSSSEKQFHELGQEMELTRLYIELEQLRYAFSSDVVVDDDVSESTLVPVMLLQPYVENAIKHGVASMEEKGKISVHVSRASGKLVIEILDNGPGLTEPNASSSGIHLGRERIRNLNNLYSGEASVEIKDRTDTSGVRVTITLPEE